MVVASASAGLNVASVYKQFASVSPALAGDGFQSLVGGLGALSNGLGRIFWGTLSDKIGFKQSFALLTLVQALVHAYYPSTASSKTAFTIFTCLCYFFLAGNFALMPPSVQRLFGPKNGSLIYGIVYSAFGAASIGALFMNKHLTESLGFEGVFRILSLFSIVATILASQLVPLKSFKESAI
jgi:OFA family oxalate/formate antiporter-like MFS transporter